MAAGRKIKFRDFPKTTQELIATIAKEAGITDYWNAFQSRRKEYVILKYTICQVLAERGLSTVKIGIMLRRDHTSVHHILKKSKDCPRCLEISSKINRIYFEKQKTLEMLERYKIEQSQRIMFERVRDSLNIGKSADDITKDMNQPKDVIGQFIELVKCRCQIKKVPDYKNYTTKIIYV